jgi:cell fate regulator YaaT (PSP1 superfamily)
MYDLFAEKFTKEFPEAVPLTARMNSHGNQVYFYFFAETRFQFGEFVKTFRQQIGYHFFLYQVGARDRVRLHPRLEERYDPSGMPLMYHIFKHPLPNVESDMLASQ